MTLTMAKKQKEVLDDETMALIAWCIEVEGFLVAGGASMTEAQDHIEEQIEWFTDQYYDGMSPQDAAKEALA
jgi:pyridoxine 5'-phosphate synthase PdxJ